MSTMLTRKMSSMTPEPTFSFYTTLAFAVNNAMGAGFLTIPYAFYHSGILLGILCHVVIAIPLLLSVPMVLETMARGDLAFRVHLQSLEENSNERTALIKKRNVKNASVTAPFTVFAGETEEGTLMVGNEKIEMSELCQMFMGMRWKNFFTFCTGLYNYGCLWAFTAVFSNALAYVFPIFDDHDENYLFYAAVFAAIVIPLTIVGVQEQVNLQIVLFFCRVLVVVIMVTTSFNAYVNKGVRPLHDATPTPLFDMSGLSVVLPIAAYAFLFTVQIPVIAEPVRNKRNLVKIFHATIFMCLVGYTLVGIFVSLLFGSNILSSCNLHWAKFTFGGYIKSPHANSLGKVFIESLSFYCLAFPALDVVSAYPLMAIALGNNLAATCTCGSDDKEISEEETEKRAKIFRLISAVPPLVGACFVSNLGAITSYTGISGCVLGYIFPPLLSILSEHYFKMRKWNPGTIHSSSWSNECRYGMIVFGAILICYLFAMIIKNPMEAHDEA